MKSDINKYTKEVEDALNRLSLKNDKVKADKLKKYIGTNLNVLGIVTKVQLEVHKKGFSFYSEQKENTLLKESMYLSTLALLIHRYGRAKLTPAYLPENQNKVETIKELLRSFPERDFSLTDLASHVDLSPWHFLREFKKHTGLPPHSWLVQIRLQKACQLLKQGYSIAMTAQNCGFSDQSHLNRHFKKAMGVTPSQYLTTLNH